MKKEGSISEYESKTSRLRKYYYRMEIELFLSDDQAEEAVSNLIQSLPKSLRRG